MKASLWKSNFRYILGACILLLLWGCLSKIINNEIFLPSISSVFESLKEIILKEGFFYIILSTLLRAVISFFVALIFAISLVLLALLFPFMELIIKPVNAIAKTIPTMVLVILALIWFNKELAPYIIGGAIVFPILYEGILNSILELDIKLLQMIKIYEVNLKDKILKIYIPVMKQYIIGILVATFSLGFKVVIAGEVYGQPKFGIGSEVQIEKVNFNTAGIFAWIIIIAVISIIFELLNKYLKKKVYRWKSYEKVRSKRDKQVLWGESDI